MEIDGKLLAEAGGGPDCGGRLAGVVVWEVGGCYVTDGFGMDVCGLRGEVRIGF